MIRSLMRLQALVHCSPTFMIHQITKVDIFLFTLYVCRTEHMFQGSHQIGRVKPKRINDTIRHHPNYCVMKHYYSNTWNYCVILIMFHYLWLFSTWMQHECWMICPFSFSRNRKGLFYFSYFSPELEWVKKLRSQGRKQSHSPTLQQVHTIDNNSACHLIAIL
jgi:hypothetical protein